MSNTNDLPTSDESKPVVCSSGCHSCGNGILRAAIYMPMIVILGGLATLAMFPDLADYGYPLIGNPSHTGFTGERPCSIILGNSSCSAPVALPGSCSFPSNPSSSSSTESSGCCPMSRARQISSEANTESPATAEASCDFVTESTTTEQVPADATLPLNLVNSDVPSN